MRPLLPRLRAAVERRVTRLRRRRAVRSGPPILEETVRLRTAAGIELHGHVHHPEGSGPWPAVLLCPGIDDPGSVFDGWLAPIRADEVAQLGALVLHFDPAGRGQSWGQEDFGGDEHQAGVKAAIEHLRSRRDVDPERIGVVAISLGLAMAVGAVARQRLPVAWLLDWEGPCDREIITAGGRIMAPADGHSLDDARYWEPREAVRHVGSLPCGYVRLQAERDHAQPGEHRHALRMMRAVSEGSVPWFQLNEHPRGVAPDAPRWLPSGTHAANEALLRTIRGLLTERRPG